MSRTVWFCGVLDYLSYDTVLKHLLVYLCQRFLISIWSPRAGATSGRSLSLLLYNLALEPLLCMIRASSALTGFRFHIPTVSTMLHAHEDSPIIKRLAYADDTFVFLSQPRELSELLRILDLYERASNAKLNREKTVVVSPSGAQQPT